MLDKAADNDVTWDKGVSDVLEGQRTFESSKNPIDQEFGYKTFQKGIDILSDSVSHGKDYLRIDLI